MNQKELGQALGVGQTTVSAWETGKTEPDSVAMNKMAQMFHVSIGYLMGYEKESVTRGLSQEEHDAMVERALAERERKEIEKMIEQTEGETDMDEEEIAEAQREQDEEDFKEATAPDTLEGFLASRIIDEQPIEIRQKLLSAVRFTKNLLNP